VVVDESTVSWQHAQVWVEGGAVWIRDLDSRNGTFLGEERLRKAAPLPPGLTVRLGSSFSFVVQGAAPTPSVVARYLVDLKTGLRHPLRGERFRLGRSAQADLRLPDGPEHLATLLLHADGEVSLGLDDEERPLAFGSTWEVGGHPFRLEQGALDHAPTAEWVDFPYPYRLELTPDGPTGPQALLCDLDRDHSRLFTGNNGVLLLVLGSRLAEDRARGLSRDEEGWSNDADVAKGIWGKASREANTLHVQVYRLRGHLKREGFDPWFIEKRQWGIRVRLREVVFRSSG
jgi:hypothetical protein